MPNLEYSNDALNVYSAFLGVDKMVYVEGDDDIAFWSVILSQFNIDNIEIQEVGGDEELARYIDKIRNGEIEAIVAKDLDFSLLEDGYEIIDNVITTYGHSIENTLICPLAIQKILKAHGRIILSEEEKEAAAVWLNEFTSSFNLLVKYDALNELQLRGLNVLFGNCSTFMRSRVSPFPCEDKITKHINDKNLSDNFDDCIFDITEKVTAVDKDISDFIRGHFLFSGVLRYINYIIKNKGSSKNASNDVLFSGSVLVLENTFNDQHPHYSHYQNEISRLSF
ncbi:DUF4435 domain-containing protein [Colwellia sp. UCD-KL20]|uniref:DUF4435 domain-containing protein n=1 Tax=Colwellia sp. UCD-KL20 TaxID=1917165 RepID=UPI000970C620|nr:DUF4435 domain-containing protein [Colwellia sp. UCD-KL20]